MTTETGQRKVMTLCTVFLSHKLVSLKDICRDSTTIYLWIYIRNEPKLAHSSDQRTHLVNQLVSVYSLLAETALFPYISICHFP